MLLRLRSRALSSAFVVVEGRGYDVDWQCGGECAADRLTADQRGERGLLLRLVRGDLPERQPDRRRLDLLEGSEVGADRKRRQLPRERGRRMPAREAAGWI